MDERQQQLDHSLFKVIDKNYPMRVREMLAEGANANARSDYQTTPLMAAAFSGLPDILQILVDHDAEVHAADRLGATALHHAFDKIDSPACAACVRKLLELGSNVDHRDNMGRTALVVALERGLESSEDCSDAIGLLLDAGANLHLGVAGSTAYDMLLANRDSYNHNGLEHRINAILQQEEINRNTPSASASSDRRGPRL